MTDYGADANPDLDKIHQVARGYYLAPQPNLKVDQFSTDGPDKVYHLVRKIGSTNLHVLVDPASVPPL